MSINTTNFPAFVNELFFKTLPAQYAHSWRFTVGCGTLCALTAVEMALRAVGNVFEMISNGKNDNLSYDFSANVGGALFYGMCAVNILPGAPIIGAAIFAIYSCVKHYDKDARENYVTSTLLGKVILDGGKLPWQIFKKIASVFDIFVPKHPIWIGVCVMFSAVVVTKVVLPALGFNLV